MEKIEADPLLSYKLPKPNALAGHVLKHVFSVLETHLKRHQPSTYKIGVTHCPTWRFYNDLYGYTREKQRWEGMTVLYISHESTGPAFAEAAAIQKHIGIQVAFILGSQVHSREKIMIKFNQLGHIICIFPIMKCSPLPAKDHLDATTSGMEGRQFTLNMVAPT